MFCLALVHTLPPPQGSGPPAAPPACSLGPCPCCTSVLAALGTGLVISRVPGKEPGLPLGRTLPPEGAGASGSAGRGPRDRVAQFHHFTDEETEALRGCVMCQWLQSREQSLDGLLGQCTDDRLC